MVTIASTTSSTPTTTEKKPPVGPLDRKALGGLKALALKAEPGKGIKKAKAAALDEDEGPTRKFVGLGDMPEVDMTIGGGEDEPIGDLEGDEGQGEKAEENAADKMDVDVPQEEEEEVDPLDAFMTGVKEEVKKVNLEDRKKFGGLAGAERMEDENAEETDQLDGEIQPTVEDELDATDLKPEDILACVLFPRIHNSLLNIFYDRLAAKKAKKKDVANVDHSKIAYESFRKEFYHEPPEIAEMDEDEVNLLRLSLDGIKIRGQDCPKPITRWSHCGLPAIW